MEALLICIFCFYFATFQKFIWNLYDNWWIFDRIITARVEGLLDVNTTYCNVWFGDISTKRIAKLKMFKFNRKGLNLRTCRGLIWQRGQDEMTAGDLLLWPLKDAADRRRLKIFRELMSWYVENNLQLKTFLSQTSPLADIWISAWCPVGWWILQI